METWIFRCRECQTLVLANGYRKYCGRCRRRVRREFLEYAAAAAFVVGILALLLN